LGYPGVRREYQAWRCSPAIAVSVAGTGKRVLFVTFLPSCTNQASSASATPFS
jgi:hypothetical protein